MFLSLYDLLLKKKGCLYIKNYAQGAHAMPDVCVTYERSNDNYRRQPLYTRSFRNLDLKLHEENVELKSFLRNGCTM